MKKSVKKINFLHPEHRRKIKKLFEDMHESIDLLYELATTDEKTGLYNNKFFNSVYEMEFEKAERGQPLTLAIIDIDHFKKINDNYGHLEADKILLELSTILKKSLRKSDVVARFGGEEFFILLPKTSSTRAKKIIQRICKKISENKKLKKINLTVSVGISEYKEKDSKSRLQKRADNALYSAKKNGRDRIEII